MPENVEEKALKELERYEKMPASSAESSVLRNYLDWLIQLPWVKETEDILDVNRAERILDEDHYGLEKVKERVIEYLAVQQLTKELKGPILCLAGPLELERRRSHALWHEHLTGSLFVYP